eukprot:454824_1
MGNKQQRVNRTAEPIVTSTVIPVTSELPLTKRIQFVTYGYIRNEIKETRINIPKAIKLLISSFVPNLWIDSNILTPNEQDSLLSMVNNHPMTKKFARCEWKLLLRASRDGDSTKIFHELCDHKKNTICFVETEYGHVCGGYVETEWKNGRDNIWDIQCDNAYMFVVRPTSKIFEQKKTSKSSVAHYWGDSFNFGYNDLYLKDNKKGYCHSYNHYNFKTSKEVAGGEIFIFVDYEVFQLIMPE